MTRNVGANQTSPQASSRRGSRESHPGDYQTTAHQAVQATTPGAKKDLHGRKGKPIRNIIIHRYPSRANTERRQTSDTVDKTPKHFEPRDIRRRTSGSRGIKNSNSQYLFLAFPLHSRRFHHLFFYSFKICLFLPFLGYSRANHEVSCPLAPWDLRYPPHAGTTFHLPLRPGTCSIVSCAVDGSERPGRLLWLVEPGHLRISRKKNRYYCTQSSIRKAFNNNLGISPTSRIPPAK